MDINGGMAEDGIMLVFGYEENCFWESAENDAYILYSVGARIISQAESCMEIIPTLRFAAENLPR